MSTSELIENEQPEEASLQHYGATSIGESRWDKDGRKVFVKRLRPEFAADRRYQEALRKEFEIGICLDSPYLPKYLRLEGESIVEEFIDGVPLDEFVAIIPDYLRNEANLTKMFCQLLEGLGYLHERQILHLDLKPSNILVTRIGNVPKIIDFGFSYTDAFVTSPGATKEFAAPEQMQAGGKMNVTTDIYAIGRILLYINKEIGLPKRFQKVAEKCCMERPEDRYDSVEELRAALTGKRRKPYWGWSAVACACLVLGLAVMMSGKKRASELVADSFCVDGICYKVVTDSTLRVIAPDSTDGRNTANELDLIIPESLDHDGKTFKVTSIDSMAYQACTPLIALTLPASIDSIGYAAFAFCNSITNVYIPNSVTYIGRDAFRECNAMKAVRLPEHLTSIERGLFSCCRGLEEIDIPASVKIIRQDAFGICHKLSLVQLHEGLETIERGVFWECQSLHSLVIPSTVTGIGDYAFWGCTSLTDIYMRNPIPPSITNIFKNLRLRIHVPKDAVERYRTALFWKEQIIIPE